jgi:ribosomal protein S27AE
MAGLGDLDGRVARDIAEIVSGMKEWRLAHPRATFAEIEEAVDAKFDAARARLVGELAQASRAADQGGQAEADRARCPDCGGRLRPRGRGERAVVVRGGEEVRLRRDYAVCPACGTGVFPPRRRA